MSSAQVLRKLLQGKEIVVVPGVNDSLTARIAQHCGFSVIYMTGYGTSALYGYPDFGLLTMSEMVENVRRITDAFEIPLIADADTGYGNPINVYRTVKEYEKAGAAGIQLEDQTWPKRCGHMEGKTVIEAEEMVCKIKAAADARSNSEMVLVIRTDSIATHGLEEAIHRGQLYADAGADVIFIEAPDRKQMGKIPLRLSKPCLLNVPFPIQDISVKAIEEMGYRIALYPLVTLIGTIGGCLKMCKTLFEEGRLENAGMPFSFRELHQFLGLDKFRDLEQKFTSKQQR
ncbi:MAG: isocitrate lyase/PEP mutase family protein [Thermodesulfobacteriota bacterium]|jgi:2-methylisocitrate lyase-like PEP mutase family enzyme